MSSNPPPPNPVNKQSLVSASKAGGVLSVVGIILFVVFWLIFGQLGVEHIQRLLLSLCIPPAIIAGIAFFFFRRYLQRLEK